MAPSPFLKTKNREGIWFLPLNPDFFGFGGRLGMG
jgi:hypothetical protein